MDSPKLAKPRSEIGKIEGTKSVSIYLAFNSTVPNLMINDESLRVLFGSFGTIEDVSIKQSVIDRQTLCQRGYAFVCFAPNELGVQAAIHASSQMGDCIIDGVHYRCEVSKSLKNIIQPDADNIASRFSSYHQPHEISSVGSIPYGQPSDRQQVYTSATTFQQQPGHSLNLAHSHRTPTIHPPHNSMMSFRPPFIPTSYNNVSASAYWPPPSPQLHASNTYPPSTDFHTSIPSAAPIFPGQMTTYPSTYQAVAPSVVSQQMPVGSFSTPSATYTQPSLAPTVFSSLSSQQQQNHQTTF